MDDSLRRIHERVDKLGDRVLILEQNTIKREGPYVDRLSVVENAVLTIRSNTTAIKEETAKSFSHTQAYLIIILMIANTLVTLYTALQH